jgi:hypothetical protein
MGTTRIIMPLGTPANVSFTSETIDLETLPISYIASSVAAQILPVGTTASIRLTVQISNDGFNFINKVNFDTSSNTVQDVGLTARYLRFAFSPQTNTTGTVSAIAYIK